MATSNAAITTPIAQNQTNSCRITLPWFVQQTEYNPATATFRPLVNGEEAFGAVYDAILGAKHSVDIICWGFQPSMYFRRGAGDKMSIGELLVKKGKDGRKVRLLCWHDDLYMSELSENNMPGNDVIPIIKRYLPDWVYSHISLLSRDYQTNPQLAYDSMWYLIANLNNVSMVSPTPISVMRRINAMIMRAALSRTDVVFKNIEFATRDFNMAERAEIAWRTYMHGSDTERDTRTKVAGSASMGAAEPTHHQKMVLIDYEDPALATGFVMGHNMLDQYWDKDDHSAKRQNPDQGRCGPSPWQDMSSRVTGPILQYLNDNFCEAWDDATGQSLGKSRKGMEKQLKVRADSVADIPVMAQVLRTQSQEAIKTGKNVQDIQTMYLQAVNNATKCIFIQNQYFRWVPLATKIKEAALQQIKCGRDLGDHGPIYLFVITNSGDEAVGTGTLNTYRMLDALGQSNAIPGVTRAVQNISLDAQQKSLQTQLAAEQASWQKIQSQGVDPFSGQAAGLASYYQSSQMHQQELQQGIDAIKRQKRVNANVDPAKDSANRDVPSMNVTGLKVHVCTLVAPDSPPGAWVPVYVHAKLMTIDDAFMTLGSANINSRSMEADSELNICHENGTVTSLLRQKLWNLHSGEADGQEDPANAFKTWGNIIKSNADLESDGKQPPIASLVGFLRTSPAISRKD